MSIRPVALRTPIQAGRTGRAVTVAAVMATLGALGLAACGAGQEHVGVAAPAHRPTAHRSHTMRSPTVIGSAPACSPRRLSVDQAPLSAGTGSSSSAWSITNESPSTCDLPTGQPALAFVDSAGHEVAHYSVTHLSGPSEPEGSAVRLARGGRAWFVTEESTIGCGVGSVLSGGPFRYEVALPGVPGTAVWAPGYLAGRSLTDFCADVALRIGDLQPTPPAAP